MKTLNTIQVLAKIGKVLSKITYIVCLVGGICCCVGLVCLWGIPDAIKIGGVTVYGLIPWSRLGLAADTAMNTAVVASVVGMILCAGECVVAKMAERYFRNELAAGTPFTMAGAQELLKLGICTICIPMVVLVACDVAYKVLNSILPQVADMHLDRFQSVGLGAMMIFLSLVCRYGAELQESQTIAGESDFTSEKPLM